MALPKLSTPTFTTTLPLSGKKIEFRPYNLGDEKLLIAAASARSKDPQFFVDNTLKVLRGCLLDNPELVDKVPSTDVEYFLMMIRARSVNEVVQVRVKDPKTGKEFETEIDLTSFYVKPRDKSEYIIKLTDTVGLKMRESTFAEKASHAVKYQGKDNSSEVIFELIIDSVESIYDEDTAYIIGVDTTREELTEFLMGITNGKRHLYEFIRNTPQLAIKVNINGEEVEVPGNQVDFLPSRTDTSI